MNRKVVLFLTVVLFTVASAHAIGISPGRTILTFTPNMNYTQSMIAINTENKEVPATTYACDTNKGFCSNDGTTPYCELAQYVEITPTNFTIPPGLGLAYFTYTIRLPEWLRGPIKCMTNIGVAELPPSNCTGSCAITGSEHQLWIDVPLNPPHITSTPVTIVRAGALYTYDVEASDVDVPHGDMLTFALVTAPSGMSIDNATGLISWIPGESQIGYNFANVSVTDNTSASDYQAFTIIVENNLPPIVTIFSPQNKIYNSETITLNYTADDITINECWHTLDGITPPYTGECINKTFTVASDGPHSVTVYASDDVGDTGNASINFTVDTTPPTYSNIIASPASPATYAVSQAYRFNSTWTDATAVSKVWIEFNGMKYTLTNIGNTYTKTVTMLAAGTYKYRWFANDTLGNMDSTPEFSFVINKAPSLLVLSVNPMETVGNGAKTTVRCSSNTAQITPMLYRNNTRVSNPDIQTLSAGNYEYICNATASQNYLAPAEKHAALTVQTSDITSCPYIIRNGMQRAVTQSLTASGDCIRIAANNIVIDCQGNSITGNGVGSGINIFGYSNVTIKNCRIINFSSGVYFANSRDITIMNSQLNSNTIGIQFGNISGNIINTVAQNNSNSDFSSNGGSLVTATNFNITGNNVVSFTSKNVKIKGLPASQLLPSPSGYKTIGKYISAANTARDSWLNINISYLDSDASGIVEDSLRIWRGIPTSTTNSRWFQFPAGITSVDTANNNVYASVPNGWWGYIALLGKIKYN